jgi:hypothetical protein
MNVGAWLDLVIVGVLVIGSAAFACYRLGPQATRLWMRRQWARLLGKPLPASGEGGAGCGGCGDCASTSPAAKAGGETRVPASNIRKLER